MVVVLIGALYKRLLEWILSGDYEGINSINIIKRKGPKVFLYVDTALDFNKVTSLFKHNIKVQGGAAYVYEFYGLYKEKIDYQVYVSNEKKDTLKYYKKDFIDLSNEELEKFKKSKGL